MPLRARARIAAFATLPVIALVGCAPGGLDVEEEAVGASTTPPPSASPTASASPEQATSEDPVADGVDTSTWRTYSTHGGDMTYRYPADWTLDSDAQLFAPDADRDDVEDPYERWMDMATLTAPNGQALLHSGDYTDVGGWCDGPVTGALLHDEPIELGGAQPGVTSTIAVVALDGSPMVFGMGITDRDWIIDDSTFGCPMYFVSSSSDGGVAIGTHFQVSTDDPLWNIDSIDDAHAYMETDEYATLLEILRSVRTS